MMTAMVVSKTMDIVAGIDEAGRGALAGPVVAGACVIPCELFQRQHGFPRWSPFKRKRDDDCLIADSKLLSPEEREHTYEWITQHCHWGVGIVEASFIESHGILRANERAMRMALEHLQRSATPSLLLVDGNDHFSFSVPHRSIIRGDQLEPCIAAASIVAKVTRDQLMCGLCDKYPNYGFRKHKGYGSEQHIAAIRTHGPCPVHRLSFLQRILTEQQSLFTVAA